MSKRIREDGCSLENGQSRKKPELERSDERDDTKEEGDVVCELGIETRIKFIKNFLAENEEDALKAGIACSMMWDLAVESEDAKFTMLEIGAVAEILKAMNTHAHCEFVQIKACGAVMSVALSKRTKSRLVEIGAVDTLLSAIQNHKGSQAVAKNACIAIETLALDKEHRMLMMARGVPETIVQVMDFHEDSADIQDSCCSFLAANLFSNETLVKMGAVDIILRAIRRHKDLKSVQRHGFAALCNFSRSDKESEVEDDLELSILEVMRRHKSCLSVQFQALEALKCLILTKASQHQLQHQLIENGILDLIETAMVTYRMSEPIQSAAITLLLTLTARGQDIESKLVMSDFANVLLIAMEKHRSSVAVQHRGCCVLSNLTAKIENGKRLVDLGVAVTITDALKFHHSVESIQREACGVVANIAASPVGQEALAKNGALPLVLRSMENFTTSGPIQYRACSALRYLLRNDFYHGSQDLSSIFVPVLRAMDTFVNDEKLHRRACDVLTNLSTIHTVIEKLVALRGWLSIIQSMRAYPGNADIQLRTCICLTSLANNSSSAKVEMIQEGVLKLVLAAMATYPDSKPIQINAAELLSILAPHVENSIDLSDIARCLFKIMRVHKSVCTIQLHGCQVICGLTMSSKVSHIHAAIDLGADELVLNILRQHKRDIGCVCDALAALRSLASCSNFIKRLVSIGVVDVLLMVMRAHKTQKTIQELCTGLLTSLSEMETNRDLLLKSRVCSDAINALQTHPDSSIIQSNVCKVLQCLSQAPDFDIVSAVKPREQSSDRSLLCLSSHLPSSLC